MQTSAPFLYDRLPLHPGLRFLLLPPRLGQKDPIRARKDGHEYIYTREQLENYQTHDEYWNAATSEVHYTGYMRDVMRMYWGKKVLEWNEPPKKPTKRRSASTTNTSSTAATQAPTPMPPLLRSARSGLEGAESVRQGALHVHRELRT